MNRLKRLRILSLAFVFVLVLCTNALAGTYVGSKNSNKYHYPTCSAAQRIKPQNLVTFNSAKEAREAGYVPCKICRPPLEDK